MEAILAIYIIIAIGLGCVFADQLITINRVYGLLNFIQYEINRILYYLKK